LRSLDALSERRRRLDLCSSAADERDRPLLLGETVGQLRVRRDACFEDGATLRRERPVRERSELGDLLTARFVFSTAPYRHDSSKGSFERLLTQRTLTP
jgi:hypothetical protein